LYLRSIGVYGTSSPGPKVTVVIPKGSSAGTVGEILEGKNVVRSELGFRIAAYLDGGFEEIQAGRYQIAQGLTAKDALQAMLDEGPEEEDFATVTFPEGSWLTDFARILGRETDLSEEKFYKLVSTAQVESPSLPDGVTTLEGLLFPSTYEIGDKEDEADVAEKLVLEFEDQLDAVGFSDVEEQNVSQYEGVIIASMVEAEAKIDADRAKIARVIYNRLAIDMALGIDATVSYALGEHKTSLTESDLAVDSPYNTRLVAGLPPTPIGAPGAASLDATAHPATGDWLYYVVSDCDGHHAFSESYQGFLDNKALYRGLDCS
ncbi:MAG: endolytic transglycosylase MltG, partial [Actinobacteria bacterium]|nr:endolytic transglycosylase MltG [Actinomycetota bacterium]